MRTAVVVLTLELCGKAGAQVGPTTQILVNQLGLPTRGSQSVLVASERPLAKDSVRATPTAVVHMSGLLSPRRDKQTQAWVHVLELRASDEACVRLTVGEAAREVCFRAWPYATLERDLVRSYYLQRCGVDIQDRVASHSQCHRADGSRAKGDVQGEAGVRIDATGGWHDAGDYGKYVATTATVLLELLTRFERYPHVLAADDLQIPESGNGVPDLLDELRVGLDWMRAMQRPDGAVYRKLSGRSWPVGRTPERDTQERFVFGVSTPETAKACAAWALAARVFFSLDPAAAQGYLDAARRAWAFLVAHPAMSFDMGEGDDAGSGPYRQTDIDQEMSLSVDADDRLAAASELFLTTGDAALQKGLLKLLSDYSFTIFEWKDVASQSLLSLLLHPASRIPAPVRVQLRAKLVRRARLALARARGRAYPVANERFVWGSNKVIAEEGVLMLAAHRLIGDARLMRTAWMQLHYLLGMNPLDKCFVTGHGQNSVAHANHLFMRATSKSFPGLLVGGPNELEQSNIAPKGMGMLSYADDERSYATNEPAIDYNSALLALLVDLRTSNMPVYGGKAAKR